MNLLNNIKILDLALKYRNYLIIADLHIGLEEALNKQGVLIPRFQFKEILKKLEEILDKVKVNTIIINGDLKHEFGLISEQEWRDTLQLVDFLTEKYKVILIKGNHDTILEPIAKKRNLEILEHFEIDDISIQHGNKIIPTKKNIIIIGHEHPAIRIKSEVRSEIYKCFLVGKWENKKLIVQPSFNFVTEGTNILREKLLSPYLKDISNFDVYVVGDKVYKFGKVKEL